MILCPETSTKVVLKTTEAVQKALFLWLRLNTTTIEHILGD